VITELEYDDPVWAVTVRAEHGRAKLYGCELVRL
jgi:hypothetical protein